MIREQDRERERQCYFEKKSALVSCCASGGSRTFPKNHLYRPLLITKRTLFLGCRRYMAVRMFSMGCIWSVAYRAHAFDGLQ